MTITNHYENRKLTITKTKTEFAAQHEVLEQIYLYVYSVTILEYVDVQQNC
jgi:hypothetical protein